MPLRITQGMINTQLLTNLNNNMRRMDSLQNQLSTGRRINAPSDDPVGIIYSLRYRSELESNDQYQKNVDSATSYLDYTDTMLKQAGDVLHRARELAVQGANGTNPQTALDSIASEIDSLYNQLVDVGNSQLNGKYIFNGQMTDLPPYLKTTLQDIAGGGTGAMDNAPDPTYIQYELGAGVKLAINVKGNEAFGERNAADNAFQILSDLKSFLNKGDTTGVSNIIGRLDQRLNKVLESRAEVGARMNRIDLMHNRLDDISINLQSLQSKTEDADIAEVITNLKTSENVYQSSLAVGSKIISTSLVEFLR